MLLLMLAGMGGASANTYFDTTNEVSGVWNEAGSTYYVNETLYVPADSTLTIGPNVTVWFAPDAGIVVNGTLVVEGNATYKVIFDSLPVVDDAEGAWMGLSFNAGSVGSIDHASINNTLETLRVIDSELAVTNTVITNTIKAVNAEFEAGGQLHHRRAVRTGSFDRRAAVRLRRR